MGARRMADDVLRGVAVRIANHRQLGFLKRGFGRTAHLVSIDIRNDRKTREESVKLVDEFDGKRPAALDLFLDYLGLKEEEFLKVIEPHVVAPHKMPSCEECMRNRTNWVPKDFEQWTRVSGTPARDKAPA